VNFSANENRDAEYFTTEYAGTFFDDAEAQLEREKYRRPPGGYPRDNNDIKTDTVLAKTAKENLNQKLIGSPNDGLEYVQYNNKLKVSRQAIIAGRIMRIKSEIQQLDGQLNGD
jgi:hypothetical protein